MHAVVVVVIVVAVSSTTAGDSRGKYGREGNTRSTGGVATGGDRRTAAAAAAVAAAGLIRLVLCRLLPRHRSLLVDRSADSLLRFGTIIDQRAYCLSGQMVAEFSFEVCSISAPPPCRLAAAPAFI